MEKISCNREEKGKEIALNPNVQITRLNDYTYHVRSQTTNREYDVIHTESGWICTCPDHQFRKVCCKHIHGVEFSIKLREEVRRKNSITIKELCVNRCPECESENFVKHGIRHNKNYDLQRYYCNECHKWFSFNVGFTGMRVDAKTITFAMQLYFTGESLRNVQKFLKLQGVKVSHQTVYNWIKKYTKIMHEYLNKVTPLVGDTWRADELWVKIKGDLKYVFALMDDETRYLIAHEVADRKEGHDASSLFKKGKQVTQTKPKVIITDGLPSYHEAYMREFWTQKRETKTIHINHIHLKGDRNNNKMERLNNEIRDREKVMRGLKKSDTPILKGYEIYHNYVRPHMALNGATPSEKAGIKIEGENKWITLIQNSSLG